MDPGSTPLSQEGDVHQIAGGYLLDDSTTPLTGQNVRRDLPVPGVPFIQLPAAFDDGAGELGANMLALLGLNRKRQVAVVRLAGQHAADTFDAFQALLNLWCAKRHPVARGNFYGHGFGST